MTLEPEHADRQRGELADALRRLRRAAGLTGAGLATRTGMSQAKVSKIENNRVRPSVVDVERILTALGISTTDDDGSRLIELARIASSDYQGFRISLQRGLGELQRDLSAIESAASTVRFFLPCMITGLLQTPEYARQTLTHPLVNRGAEWRTALARRLERQQILYRPGKRFVFVLTEAALRWPLCPPEVMALQMDRIASLSELAGVDIHIVRAHPPVPSGPLNGFTIYDDRLVTVEVFTGELALRDPKDISYSREIFDFFHEHALSGENARSFLDGLAQEFRFRAQTDIP
ncbi:helix-turn-helix domain-containing protein [Nocardiopsis sp. LDBS1602]|uniref:helix-turn-helix domain-containing protein n=1 Tax=Nocardiopsis sp. LDBS1602 TaxID=3109597 RepID=UPI002DBD39EC|nr:helix-turn-helix transcriptional regulator [Nocardiopsis sp. LDBS1602]MEC3891841.1 helix-turn-helix transcriptional regulator [Nocardiopsis sp. LDBS1602]